MTQVTLNTLPESYNLLKICKIKSHVDSTQPLYNHAEYITSQLPVTQDRSTVRSESYCVLRLWYVDLVVSIEAAAEVCCCFTVFSC
jgi:hypothetical protein